MHSACAGRAQACLGNGQPWPRTLGRIEGQPKHVPPPRGLLLSALQQRGLHTALPQQEAHKGGRAALPLHPRAADAVAPVDARWARVDAEQQPNATRADASGAIVAPHRRLFSMRRRPDDRPTGLPRAYSRQAVLIAAFHDVVVATCCRARLLDLALPVPHLTSGRAVHERLPQLRPVRDKWVEHAMPSVAIVLAAIVRLPNYRSGVHRSWERQPRRAGRARGGKVWGEISEQ